MTSRLIQWMPSIEPLDWTMFPDCLSQNRVVVIHFWAIWDTYDPPLDATIQDLRRDYEGKIKFFSQDVDQEICWELIRECGIRSVPVLACFLNGKFHENIIGLRTGEQLKSIFEAWIAKANNESVA